MCLDTRSLPATHLHSMCLWQQFILEGFCSLIADWCWLEQGDRKCIPIMEVLLHNPSTSCSVLWLSILVWYVPAIWTQFTFTSLCTMFFLIINWWYFGSGWHGFHNHWDHLNQKDIFQKCMGERLDQFYFFWSNFRYWK